MNFIKKISVRFLFVILFILATFFLSGCSLLEMQSPEIRKITPGIKGLDFKGVDMEFDIQVYNSYPVPLKSPAFDYGINVEGSKLFESQTKASVNLPAGKTGSVKLPMRFEFVELIRAASSLKNKPQANYELFGAFHFKPFNQDIDLPFSHQGVIPIPKPPKISIKDISVTDASLTSAKLKIDASILNPNIFGVNLKDLGYKLKLGDIDVGGLSAGSLGEIASGKEGTISLTGHVSGLSAVRAILKGANIKEAAISPSGAIETPYGKIPLP